MNQIKQKIKLTFVSGNEIKAREAGEILKEYEIENIPLDIPEMQGNDDEVVKEKARLACDELGKAVFVDDTALCFNALNGLPGHYIKEFVERLRLEKITKMLDGFDDKTALAACIIGFCEPGKKPMIFKGEVKGSIVKPRGMKEFSWDPIFLPDGHNKTYAEMKDSEKNAISHRRKALLKFKEYLKRKHAKNIQRR